MLLDFTTSAFDTFCQRISHMPVFAVADYLRRSTPPPLPYLVLRLDVDYREEHAVALARIAAWHRLRGSFYFRHHRDGFDLAAMRAVADLGHEIGYHFETLDMSRGNSDRAERLLLDHLDLLRAAGFTIETVAAHGAPPTGPGYQANYDLFKQKPDLMARAGLLGETTLSVDFRQVVYVSDANWRWTRYEFYRPGLSGQPYTLRRLLHALSDPHAALYVNIHPHQWFSHPASAIFYRARNRIGRRVLPLWRKLVRRV